MTINSTEFQQRVGYYMDLVDAGEEVLIEKRRPKGKVYRLSSEKATQVNNNPKDIIEKMRQLTRDTKFTGETGLEIQNRVRS